MSILKIYSETLSHCTNTRMGLNSSEVTLQILRVIEFEARYNAWVNGIVYIHKLLTFILSPSDYRQHNPAVFVISAYSCSQGNAFL